MLNNISNTLVDFDCRESRCRDCIIQITYLFRICEQLLFEILLGCLINIEELQIHVKFLLLHFTYRNYNQNAYTDFNEIFF